MEQARTIIIVDDDIKASTFLQDFLQNHDFAADWVPSGEEMFKFLKQKKVI